MLHRQRPHLLEQKPTVQKVSEVCDSFMSRMGSLWCSLKAPFFPLRRRKQPMVGIKRGATVHVFLDLPCASFWFRTSRVHLPKNKTNTTTVSPRKTTNRQPLTLFLAPAPAPSTPPPPKKKKINARSPARRSRPPAAPRWTSPELHRSPPPAPPANPRTPQRNSKRF